MEISELLERIFGCISPWGDTTIDDERFANFDNYEKAVNFFIDELIEAVGFKDSAAYSVNRAGQKAYDILLDIKYKINRIIEEED